MNHVIPCLSKQQESSQPCLLRAVRAWLTLGYWHAFASAPPPAELAALLGALNAGHGINLYLRL